jgi:glutamate--cysteine ligase
MREQSDRFAALRDAIHAESFAPGPPTRRVGAEVELLVLDGATGVPLALVSGRRPLVPMLRTYAARKGWRETPGYGRVPKFVLPGQGIISFEPGGQLEISTDPCETVTELVTRLQAIIRPLRLALHDQGVRVESVGIDPVNDARDIPLQLLVDRYETMTRYFDRRGPFGVRMMRQTAAIQVSLDRGVLPAERWRMLNDLTPYVIAMFANSPHYRGDETGHRSYRAHCWRMLDPTRTGAAVPNEDPAAEYARFALAASDMVRSADGPNVPFAEREIDDPRNTAWQTHLTTLFPEVRPRGHFEVRSCDAVDEQWYAAPIVFLTGLAYDERAARDASILAADSRALLRAAGETGLRDASIARTARDLFQLALAGARRLGDAYCGGAELETAVEFFATYTARDRSPADDRVLPASVPERASAVAPST